MNDYTRITPDPLSSPNNNRRNLLIGGGCLLLFMCLACAGLIVGISGYMVYLNYGEELTAVSATQEPQVPITPSPEQLTVATRITPSPLPTFTNTPSATHDTALADPALTPETTEPPTHTAVPSLNLPVPPEINQTAVPANAQTYLDQLYQTEYPSHDYYQTAQHLGEHNPPPTLDPPPGPYQIGDNHTFFNDTDAVNATLLAITDHAYFWVEDELNLDQTDVAEAANQFENEYYDRLIHLFGQVWDPGIDNDPHISVLHISNSAADELGYFNSEDEYISDLFEYSNEQEIIYLNMGELNLGDDLYYATLVHETQHLIQWYVDPSESVWLNEGLSQLAEVYLGFTDTAETIDYLQNPATQLNKWNYDEDEVYAHYAAAFLFSVYLWEQLGETAVQELSRHPANGLAAVYAILQGYAPEEMTLETFSANWAAANFLDDSQAAPQYYYRNLDFRQPSFQHEVEENTPFEVTESLNQFGVHYIDLRDLHGETTITFAADTATSLIDTPAREDEIFWYAPAVNEMDAYLTAGFDLTAVNQANLGYSVWYDLEDIYDFAYISISTDGGQTWDQLPPRIASVGEYGAGYNGRSADKQDNQNGWLKESISLNDYVGHNVLIRFDVLTDSGITGQGFALDNLSISEYGYEATFQDGPEGWQPAGFVRTGQQLPQKWALLLIEEDSATVTPIPLNNLNQAQATFNLGKAGGILTIMPQTPFITQPANYWLIIDQPSN